jgi:polysaccharide biosynthesis/export protein
LRGRVAAPLRYPWKKGMRITDLLVDENALITSEYWDRQNRGAVAATPSQREVNFDYATVQRLERDGLRTRIFAFSLGKAIQNDPRENVELLAGDIVTVYGFSDQLPKSENDVVLNGSTVLGVPARRFPWREGMRVRDLIPSAGFLVDYYNYFARSGPPSSSGEIHWDYANVSRLQADDLTRSLLSFNLGRAVLDRDDAQNIPLRSGDEITIFAKSEIPARQARHTILVRLEGEFEQAGVYQAQPGETLRQLVVRVGGITPAAYLFGAELNREATRRDQEARLKQAVDQLEQDFQRAATTRAQNVVTSDEATTLKTEAESQRTLIARLRNLKPSGRIVLELRATPSVADLPDIALQDGDRLFVPARPSQVSVFGTVFNESSFLYRPEKTVFDYLAQAGGPRKEADTGSTYVLRADGSVVSRRQSGIFSGSLSGMQVMPGDTIVVPEDFARTTWTKDLKDWTQILYQFGLGAAALKVLRD